MKRLILTTVMILLAVGITYGQTEFSQVYRNNGSGAAGSTWAKSATHYSNYIDMSDVDSAWIVFNFTDTVDVLVQWENYTSTSDGVVSRSDTIGEGYGNTSDTICVKSADGASWSSSLTGAYEQGFPIGRIKLTFSAYINDTQATEKYKMYIKKFKHTGY